MAAVTHMSLSFSKWIESACGTTIIVVCPTNILGQALVGYLCALGQTCEIVVREKTDEEFGMA